MMIRQPLPGCAARMRLVASSPSISGIRMSIRTTSGRCRSTAATASLPLAASAMTGMPLVRGGDGAGGAVDGHRAAVGKHPLRVGVADVHVEDDHRLGVVGVER